MPTHQDKPFRYGVVAVFLDDLNRLLICQRTNRSSVWQFPQGGIDPGETEHEALLREVNEEIGVDAFDVLKTSKIQTKYFFPKEVNFGIARQYCGQIHRWFLCRLHEGVLPNLEKSDHEFSAWKWTSIEKSLETTVYWKQDAYKQGLKLLGLEKP